MWGADDYRHLGQALRYCGALEVLTLERMAMSNADAAAVLVGPPIPSLKTLNLTFCDPLTTLPALSAFSSLEGLYVQAGKAMHQEMNDSDEEQYDVNGFRVAESLAGRLEKLFARDISPGTQDVRGGGSVELQTLPRQFAVGRSNRTRPRYVR